METFHFDLVLKSWRVLAKFCVTQHLFQKCFTKCLTDLFDDVTQNCHFLCFSLNKNSSPWIDLSYRISLTCDVSGKSVANSRKYELRAQICQYLQRNVCQRGGGGGGDGGEATGYCSNYYENQSNKLIIILNQPTCCYSFTSISNKTEIN